MSARRSPSRQAAGLRSCTFRNLRRDHRSQSRSLRALFCLLLLTDRGWAEDTKADKPSGALALTATVHESKLTHSDPVVLKFVMTNNSGKRVEYIDLLGPIQWVFLVTAPDGTPATPTTYAKQAAARDSHASKKTSIDPGEERTWYVLLNRYCDMSIDGTYTVKVRRDLSIIGLPDPIAVTSNAVDLIIRDEGDLRWDNQNNEGPSSKPSTRPTR